MEGQESAGVRKSPQESTEGRKQHQEESQIKSNEGQRSRRKPNKKLREVRISKEDRESATGQRIQKEAKINSKEGRKNLEGRLGALKKSQMATKIQKEARKNLRKAKES